MSKLLQLILDNLPAIITGLCGLTAGIVMYLTKRVKYKTSLTEIELEKVELQKTIAAGSYVLCPKCGEKIYLAKTRVKIGGDSDAEIKSE